MMRVQYTHPELEVDSQATERLRRWGMTPGFMARGGRYLTPLKVCETCRGKGVSETGGPYAGTCEGCRGFGTLDMTLSEIREAYREVRVMGCERLQTTCEAFDAVVSLCIGEDQSPAAWLQTAREIVKRAIK